jgi:hypothetical protein
MIRTAVLWSAGLLVALTAAPGARAASTFSYTWSGPDTISSDAGSNALVFSNYRGPTEASGNTGPLIICDVMTSFSDDATWTNKPLVFNLTIDDGAHTGVITLSSHFNSSLVNGVGSTQIVDGPMASAPLTFGTETYTLQWDGATSAPEIVVSSAPHATPEPSSLLLAILGVVTPAAFCLRKMLSAVGMV